MSVPQPSRAHDVQGRRRPQTNSQLRELRPVEERVRLRRFARQSTRHRLSWFETIQGLMFFAFVMLGATNGLVSGLLICVGIAMCAPALIIAGLKGRTRKPLQLVLAAAWAVVGTIYIVFRLN